MNFLTMRRISLFLMAVVFSTAIMAGCEKPVVKPDEEPDPQPVELEDLKLSVPVPENNWIYSSRPTFTIHADLVSAPDKQPDFDEFWEKAKKQLEGIALKANLIEITAKSSAKCKVYLVEIPSVPDGPEGEPITMRGYYLEPQDGTCPPHTNTAPFNNLTVTDKVMYYYPELGHQIPRNWPGLYTAFFKERIK